MDIFGKRPLCFFSFLFFSCSALARRFSFSILSVCLLIVSLAAVLVGLLVWLIRQYRIQCLTSFFGVLAIAGALFHSFFTVALPQQKADAYIGEHLIQMNVIAVERESSSSSEYIGNLIQIDDASVKIRVNLICGFSSSAAAGDRIYARVSLKEAQIDWSQKGEGILLTAYVDDPNAAYVSRISETLSFPSVLFVDSGLRILSDRIQETIVSLFEERLGEEQGALASGFFMGYRADISSDIVRDFRRAGLSHQMAISGMHISILLGTIELILRKLYVSKRIRCVTVSVLGVVFILLTGFSLSGFRSVLMLYAVYLSFFLYEDSDSLTSLFVSMAVIVLIFPYAATDLGLWMSFFATLGLVTAYPLLEEAIPYSRRANPFLEKLLRFGRTVLLLIAMTVIATLFLLPILWIFFGEISLVSVLSNLVFSPFSNLYLLCLPIFLLVIPIPWLGELFEKIVLTLGELLLAMARFFSHFPYATLSLRYPFCHVIIGLFAFSMIILLLIRLKRKWIIAIPAVAAVVAFAVCLTVFHVFYDNPSITYQADEKKNEWMMIEENSQLSVCDVSADGWQTYDTVLTYVDTSIATEIEAMFLSQYRTDHSSMFERLSSGVLIRTVYLPVPQNETERACAEEIWSLSREDHTEVVFYRTGDRLWLTKSVFVVPMLVSTEHNAWILTFYSGRNSVTYLTASAGNALKSSELKASVEHSGVLLCGSYGASPESACVLTLSEQAKTKKIIYTSHVIRESFRVKSGASEYIPQKSKGKRTTVSVSFEE